MTNYDDYTFRPGISFDAKGQPFQTTVSGKKQYMSPAAAAQSHDPRAVQWATSQGEVYPRDADGNITGTPTSTAAPRNTFAHQNNGWDPQAGQYDQSLNQGGLMGLIEGGAGLAVPLVAGPAIAAGIEGAGAGALAEPVAGASAEPLAGGTLATTTPGWAANGALSGTATGPASAAGMTSATGASMAGGSTATGGAGFLGSMKNLLTDPKFLIGTGANVLGGILSSRAAGKAADQQAQSAREALALQKDMYEQGRSDSMPWLNMGRGAASTLSRLMGGLDTINPAQMTPQTSPQPQQAVQRSPLAALAGGGQMVTMRAPDGSTRPVPAAMAAQLEARGAVRV